MSEKDKELDDIFRDKLKEPLEPQSYREEDWNALEVMLNEQRKPGGIVFWLPVLGGVAALLLLVGGWLLLRSKNSNEPTKNQPQIVTTTPRSKQFTPDTILHSPVLGDHKKNFLIMPGAYTSNGAKWSNTGIVKQKTVPVLNTGNQSLSNYSETTQTDTNNHYSGRLNTQLPAARSLSILDENSSTDQRLDSRADTKILIAKESAIIAKNKNGGVNRRANSAFRPQYAITVLAAPDLNSVGGFQQTKVGTNVGIQFSAEPIKRITVTTGAVYSDKPYLTSFANYHTDYHFKTNPESVTADCRMLDIPINVGYQIYSRHQNTVSVGTGLSSYIMLHERYSYTYSSPSVTGPAAYTVPTAGKYFFGVANLNASFEHQLNSRLGVAVQPYMKLPISNIGHGEVKLQSTGVAVGFSWSLGSAVK